MVIIEKYTAEGLLDYKGCIELMKETLSNLEEGKYGMPQRLICTMPNTAAFGFMPAYVGDYFGAKVVTAYLPNAGTAYPSHIGYVMLYESLHCTVAAMIEAGSITKIRTGCVSAAATDLLARKDSHKLSLIGAGEQARSHMEAIRLVRDIQEVSVYDIRKEAAERLAVEFKESYGVTVRVCNSVEEAVGACDIICTLCPTKEAYLTRSMVRPGTHINAVGTFTPTTREVASDLIAASRVYSDYTPSLRKESGEYLIPLQEGLITEKHIIGSLGELLLKRKAGRISDSDITVFDALGLAVEDVASARAIYEAYVRAE